MSADAIIYCLENLTDYRQFERLCSDFMSQAGYPNLEPIGGTGDGGRDALHVDKSSDRMTIFAYSVRSDWRRKLLDDCKRIQEEKHDPDEVVFVCTSTINAAERDAVIADVKIRYGWELDLYPIERLRVRLAGELQPLIAQHPAIFCPPFFNRRGGQSVSPCHDLIVIDHVANDHALATWVSRKLQLLGYRTWCLGTAPLAGEDQDDSVRELIDLRAERFLPIISPVSLEDADFAARVSYAASKPDLVIPCISGSIDASVLPKKVNTLVAADFTSGWAGGISSVSQSLSGSGVEPRNESGMGAINAVRSFVPVEVTKLAPERVYTNSFHVTVPSQINVSKLSERLLKTDLEELRKEWAFVVADARTLLSFEPPPATVPVERTKNPVGYLWKHVSEKYELQSTYAVKQLVQRSLDVACWRVGMQWCDDRRAFYFPTGSKPRYEVPFTHVDGRQTTVALNGERTLGSGKYATKFRYQLCPDFRIGTDSSGEWWATLGVYARITDAKGVPWQGKTIGRARKAVGKSWWNKHWLARTLGLIQSLAGGEKVIEIGNGGGRVEVDTTPLSWECPTAIDYEAVERLGDFQEEMAELRYIDHEDAEFDSDLESAGLPAERGP